MALKILKKMDLQNFSQVFQTVKNKQNFDDNYLIQNTHGAYICDDAEILTEQFLNNPNYELFADKQQFQVAQIWRGKHKQNVVYVKDEYFQLSPSDHQWKKYFSLYERSFQNLNKNISQEASSHSLFHQQLCYSVAKNNCCLTIDTDVFIPVQFETKDGRTTMIHTIQEDDKLLIRFMDLLRTLFAKHIRIPLIEQQYQLDPEHPLFDYVITCRGKTDDINNPDHAAKNKNFVRYGYHSYFYNLVMNSETKNQLYYLVMQDLLNDQTIVPLLKERYQADFNITEYMDKGPFVATSSLPFTAGSASSVYTFIIDPMTHERITLHNNAERFKQLFLQLNPFKGFGIPINTTRQESQNIISITRDKNNYCINYILAVRFIDAYITNTIINKDIIKWVYANIVRKTCHLYWDEHREEFIQNVYLLLNKDQFLTELFYFIAMCEDPEGIIRKEQIYQQDVNAPIMEVEDVKDGFQYNKERDRYPIKCHIQVSKEIKNVQNDINKGLDFEQVQEVAVESLIKWFNILMSHRLEHQLDLQRPIAMQITENPYSVYQKFLNFIKNDHRGSLQQVSFENLAMRYIHTQYNNFLYQTTFKNTRCIVEQGKSIQQYNNILYEYIPINKNAKNEHNQIAYSITSEQGHYKILNTSKFISIMQNEYSKLINDYSSIVNSSTQFNDLHSGGSDFDNLEGRQTSKLFKQQQIIQELTVYKADLSERQCKNLIPKLLQAHGDQQEQPNTIHMVMGVYNGILKYHPSEKNFRMMTNEECVEHFQTQTTLFKVDSIFQDSEGFLISRQDFLNSNLQAFKPYKEAYDKLISIFTDIFGESQFNVFQWKMALIVYQILKKCANQYILIEYGTGGDGKSMNNEAIQYILGLSSNNQERPYKDETRKIQNLGYATIAKPSVLITSETSSAQHDSGGFAELEQSFFASFAELPSHQPISSSALKRLAGGTSVTYRKAHSDTARSMVNKAFIVLQTNNYPRLDQTLEEGSARRILFYKYPHKFVDKHIYDLADDKTNLRIKDFSLQNIFQEDIYMVDMLGIFMLWSFLESQQNVETTTIHDPIAMPTIPHIIMEQTREFINTYDVECNAFKQEHITIQEDLRNIDVIHYLKYETLCSLIDAYCEKHQITTQRREVRANIIYFINKKYMSRIRVYKRIPSVQYKGKTREYCKFKLDINAFESYTRQSDAYKIFYEGIIVTKGVYTDENGLTNDDHEFAQVKQTSIDRLDLEKIIKQVQENTSVMSSMLF